MTITHKPVANRLDINPIKDETTRRTFLQINRIMLNSFRNIYNDLIFLDGGGAGGSVTSVGDVASGPAFDGTQGTILTFYNAGSNRTLSYDGTDFDVNAPFTSSGAIQGTRLISTVATGTAPLTVASTTKVTNLNADLLDDQEGSYYLNRANHTGTQVAATISDFDIEVSNNTDVAANTADRHSINYSANLVAVVVVK